MRVLVTGGAGFVGSHACKALAQAGHVPVAFDNLSTGHRWAVRWGPLVEGDVGDRTAVSHALRTHGIDGVMHFAASAYVSESMRNPRGYYANNVTSGLVLLDAMLDAGVAALTFSSSCATFGVQHTHLLDESHPQRPVNPYGETKLALERAIEWYARSHGLRATVLRFFNAAGADEAGEAGEWHDPEPHLIPNVLRAVLGEIPHVELYGTDFATPDGTAVRDYVHVSDLADAHVTALARLIHGETLPVAMNLGTGRGHSVREVIASAREVTGRAVPVVERGARQGDPPRLVADGSTAMRVLGWSPSRPALDSMMASAWRWYRTGGPAGLSR